VVFYFVTFALQTLFGLTLTSADAERSESSLLEYIDQLAMAQRIPTMLFISASLITTAVLVLLCWQRPDFLLRALSWLRLPARRHLREVNADNLPANGALIVATNCERLEQWMHVVSVIDRFTRFVPNPRATGDDPLLVNVSRKLGISLEGVAEKTSDRWEQILSRSSATLGEGNLVAIHVAGGRLAEEGAALFRQLQAAAPANILPVYCGEYPAQEPGAAPIPGRVSVVIGQQLPATTSVEEVRSALAKLGR